MPLEPKADFFGSREILEPLGKNPHYREFVSGNLGKPWPDERALKLEALALDYHQRCEAYDRTVCTGPIRDGAIMPRTSEEQELIDQNASQVRRELGEVAVAMGFTRWQLHEAIRNVGRRFKFDEQQS